MPDEAPPASVDEALRRSVQHGRNAVAEALLASQALLDAVALATTGRPASGGQAREAAGAAALGALSDQIESLARAARGSGAVLPDRLMRAVLDALDAEIARWEERSAGDRDARAVLRAFLGLREILWELGVRPDGPGAAAGSAAEPSPDERDPAGARAGGAARRPRVRRIDVEG